jgi:DNA invertase Pin-like site-specific DNA recombinase
MKKSKAKKAIIIARVSTEGQGENDHYSIPAQLKNLRDYVERGGKFSELSLKNILAEHELRESAFQGNRPAFTKIVDGIENLDEPVALVFDDIDRFARQVRSKLLIRLDDLRKDGKLELHFVTTNLALHRNSSANELMIWNILLAVAEGQSNMISEKVKKGNREKLEQGKFIGYSPTGYQNVVTQNGDGSFKREILVDEEREEFIRKCFHLYSTDKYSMEEIARMMNNAGFTMKTKRSRNGKDKLEEKESGRNIIRGDIHSILRNPFYYGKFYRENPDTGKWELFPKNSLATNYDPIISENLFNQVQKIIDSNNTRKNGYAKNSFKFRGLLECSFCGSMLTAEEMSRTYKDKKSAKAKDSIYYHCSNGKTISDPDFYKKKFGTDHSGVYISKRGDKKGQKIISCPQRWWKESEIEELILHEFDAMHYDDSVYESLKRIVGKDYDERMEFADKEIRILRIKIGKNEEMIKAFTHKFAIITDKQLEEDMMKEYNDLKKDQEKLRREKEIFEEAKEIDTDRAIDTMRLACDLREHYKNLDLEKKQELLSLCFSKIIACKGRWKVNGGKGKEVNSESVQAILNEPFATLQAIKIDELVAQEEDERREKSDLTISKDRQASPNP